MGETVPANQLKWLCFFIAMAVAVNFSGLFVTLIAPDATLYATIAKTMVLHHNYADIIVSGKDWLDKPHFPFWVTALFFNVFGISTWAYKLPGILFLLMGAVYTYRFAKDLYNEQVALWSVLILLTAEHIIISNNDVRAEPYLTGLIIASVYHFYKAYTRNSFWQLLFGSLFTASAIMTKGMFAIVPIGGAIVGQFIITKQWKQLFAWRWLIAIVLVLIFIIPELYCLYRQFDIHPEKVIFGQKGVSGIKFFFWDSQFGRFFNTGPIKGGGDPFFFVHTTLWAFLPWSLLFFVSIFRFIKTGIKNVQGQEWFCISGALLTFLLFSASKFQLPYYMNIVFPFFAIITAQYLYSVAGVKSIKAIRITQVIVMVLMLLVICALQYFFVPDCFTWPVITLIGIAFLLLIFLPDRVGNITMQKVIMRTVLAAVVVNLYINLAFYPSLMKYQAGSEVARWINKHNPQNYPVVQCDDSNWPMEFYLNQPLIAINPDTLKTPPANTFLLYAKTDIVNGLVAKGWHVKVVDSMETYWVSRLKPKFLNVRTRDKELIGMEVVVVNGK